MPAKKATTKSAAKSTQAKSAAKSTKAKSTKTKKSASPKTRTASTKKAASTKGKAKSKTVAKEDKEVKIERRNKTDRRVESRDESIVAAAKPAVERREKVQRRRQIDPTTCERDYSDGEVEFMSAMDEYKRTSGRMFPTCSEVLEVIRDLGYVQLTPAELATVRPVVAEEVTDSGETQADFDEAEMEVAELTC